MKKFLTFLLTCVLFITSSMPVFAMTNDKVSTETQVEIPVLQFDSKEDFEQYCYTLSKEKSTRGATVIYASVIRDGTSEDCELYLLWEGDEMYNAFRYKKIQVKSANLLSSKVYKTFGDGINYTTKNTTAASVGSVKIGDFKLDSDIEKVKVTSKGLQGYNMKSLSWLSGVEFSGTVTIN